MRATYDGKHVLDLLDSELLLLADRFEKDGDRRESVQLHQFRANVLYPWLDRGGQPEILRRTLDAVAEQRPDFTPEMVAKALAVMRGGRPWSADPIEFDVLEHVAKQEAQHAHR